MDYLHAYVPCKSGVHRTGFSSRSASLGTPPKKNFQAWLLLLYSLSCTLVRGMTAGSVCTYVQYVG